MNQDSAAVPSTPRVAGISPGLSVLAAATLTGLLGDILLRLTPWGINFPAFVLAILAATVILARRFDASLIGGWPWAMAMALACAAFLGVRDSPPLSFLNAAFSVTAVALTGIRTGADRLQRSPLVEYVHGLFLTVIHMAAGALPLLLGRSRGENGGTPSWRRWLSVVRGAAMTVPVLLFFGGLLVSADADFEYIVVDVLEIDLAVLAGHLFLTIFIAYIVSGFLRGRFIADAIQVPLNLRPASFSLGIVEVGILVGGLDLLFGSFVIIQLPYLFGGAATLSATPGLTAADYARRGFFELVGVAGFALPLLFAAEWILRKDNRRHLTIFRWLSGVHIMLLLIIMTSALKRLALYQQNFGLTESRVYATALLFWVGLVLLWLAASVLAGKRERFAFGVFVSGFAVLMVLNFLNPDDVIARTNLSRAGEGKPFDARYNACLSADATPALAEGITVLPETERGVVATRILHRQAEVSAHDWRSWNWSRMKASRAAERNMAILVEAAEKARRRDIPGSHQ
jgi:hypothetical protein